MTQIERRLLDFLRRPKLNSSQPFQPKNPTSLITDLGDGDHWTALPRLLLKDQAPASQGRAPREPSLFRPTVLVVACALFSLPSVAQSFGNPPAELSPNKRDFPAEGRQRFDRKAAAPISIVRLRIPRKAKDLFNKAMDAWHNHAAAEAQQDLDRALQLDPDFPDALTLYAGIHANHQDWGSAEEKLQAAIRSDPTFSPAYVVLAAVYNTQARFADAQRATEQAVSAGANTWEVEYETARALIGQKQFEDALTVSELALRSSPHRSMLHLAKAHALLGLRRYPEAASELKTFLQIQPSGDGCEEARSLLEQVEKIATQ